MESQTETTQEEMLQPLEKQRTSLDQTETEASTFLAQDERRWVQSGGPHSQEPARPPCSTPFRDERGGGGPGKDCRAQGQADTATLSGELDSNKPPSTLEQRAALWGSPSLSHPQRPSLLKSSFRSLF